MAKNFELKLKLSADNSGLKAEVSGSRDEIKKLSDALDNAGEAGKKGADGVEEFSDDVKSAGNESDKAGRKVEGLSLSVADLAKRSAKLAAVGLTAVTAGLSVMTVKGLENVDAQAKLARSLDATVTGIRAVQLAASDGGVGDMDMSLVRLNRRLGAAEMGVGEYATAVKILGLNLAELKKADADERLAIIADAVKSSGLSAQETARHLQTLGFEQANANQFFLAGGDAIRAARVEVDQYGLGLSEIDTAKVEAANDAWSRIGMVTESLSSRLAIALSPTIHAVADQFSESATEAGGFGDAVTSAADVSVSGLAFVLNAGDGVTRVFKVAGIGVASFALSTKVLMLQLAEAILSGPVNALNAHIQLMNKVIEETNKLANLELPTIELVSSGSLEGLRKEIELTKGAINEAANDAQSVLTESLFGDDLLERISGVKEQAEEAAEVVSETLAQTVITPAMSSRDWLGEFYAELDAGQDQAIAQAEAQLQLIEAQNTALKSGGTLIDAQTILQEKQLEAQLKQAGASDELVQKLIDGQREQQSLLAQLSDDGVVKALKEQNRWQKLNSKEQFIQAELAKLSANASKEQVATARELAGALYDQNNSRQAADAMQQDFERAMQSVATSLTTALLTEDWEASGQQIGAALGAAVGSAWGPAGQAIGGILGGAIGQGIFGSDVGATFNLAERQDNQLIEQLLGGIENKSSAISDYTEQTVSALSELIGVNRELLRAQGNADEAVDSFGARVAQAISDIGSDFIAAAGVGIRGTLDNPEYYGLFANQAIANPIQAAELERIKSLLNEASSATGDLLAEAFLSLGIDAADQIGQATFDTGSFSTYEMSAEEAAQEFSRAFGSALNQVAGQISPGLKAFVDQFGDSAGDLLQEFARNATVVDGALLGLNDSLADLNGLELGNAATSLVDVFGDAAALTSASQQLADTFLSDEKKAELNEQRLSKELDQLNEKYTELNLQLPETKAGIADLIYGLDLKTEAGRAALEVLTRSSDALVEFYEAAESGAQSLASMQNATDAAFSELSSSVSQRLTDISSQLAAEREALQEQRSAAVAVAKLSAESARTRVSAIESEVRGIQNAYDRLAQQAGIGISRDAAFNQLQLAASGGSLTDLGEALAAAQNISVQDFGTAVDYDREQRKFLAVLEQVEDKGESQLSTAERQLAASNRQISVIEDSFDEQIMALEDAAEEEEKRLQELLDDQQAQLNELRGIDQSVQSVDDSIKALQAALVAELSSRSNLTVLQAGGMTVQGWGRPDGSHAAGLNRVPFDGYRAELHRDEMVLTADVANTVRSAVGAGRSNEQLANQVMRLSNELADIKGYLRNISVASSSTADSTEELARMGVYARAK